MTCPCGRWTPAGDVSGEVATGEFYDRVKAADVLPDGRVDHRGHERDVDWMGYGWACLDCETEDREVPWLIPYDVEGRPIPEDWRDLPAATVRALCGMGAGAGGQP